MLSHYGSFMSMRSVLVAVAVVAGACGGSADDPPSAVSDAAADRLGVFVRSEGGETTVWLDVDGGVWLRSSRCSDADMVGAERDGVYYPVSIHGPGVCGAAGDVHPITGPFTIDRSDGVAVTLGDATLAFARPTAIPLDAAFTAGPLAVTDPSTVGLDQGNDVRIQIDDGRLRGTTACQSFETTLERRGSLLGFGDVRHGADCPDDERLFALLANRAVAAIAVGGQLALVGPFGAAVQLEPAPGEPVPAATGLDRTLHRGPAPFTGELSALEYLVDGQRRATAPGFPFTLRLSEYGAAWNADCNLTTAGGRWDGDRFVALDGSSTLVGCAGLAQSADLASLTDGFRLQPADGGRWTLTTGPLTVVLTPGPPTDPAQPIPAGQWAPTAIGYGPYYSSGIDDNGSLRLDVDEVGGASLDTGCRQIRLDLAPGTQRLVTGDDLPQSTCTLDDGAAPLDALAASIVTAEHAGAYLRSGQLVLSGGGRSIELAPTGS